jgi:protein-tyrosine phosphatase
LRPQTIKRVFLSFQEIESIKISIEDSPYANLGYYFDKAADKMDEVLREGKKVLVHCVAGVSRSASLILAYLIKYKGYTLRRAFQHVRVQ